MPSAPAIPDLELPDHTRVGPAAVGAGRGRPGRPAVLPRLVFIRHLVARQGWGRPTLEELRHDLRAVSRAIRPDWKAPA